MKKRISTLLLLTVCAGSLLLAGGCTKKPVIAPDGSGSLGSDKTSSFPPADGSEFSQDSLPAVGSLDDASNNGAGGLGDNASDEYKRLHGRSSEGLSPVYFDFDRGLFVLVILHDLSGRFCLLSCGRGLQRFSLRFPL